MSATSQILLGPIPHSKENWVSGTNYKKWAIVFHNGSSYICTTAGTQTEPSFTYDSTTGQYTVSSGWSLLAVGAADDLINSLKNGSLVPALAENLANWADRSNLNVEDTWDDPVRTTAGDVSIESDNGAVLVSIGPKSTLFTASALKTTGFNLLHGATAVGTGYYFLVPALPFGPGKPNGLLFTDNNGNNLTPTVRFKALADGVPTSINDGSVCEYTDSNGHRFYNSPAAGYIIVSGITLANTCAHIGWSRRYDEFISPTAAADAGGSIALTSVINALHNYGLMISLGSVADSIRFGATAATWERFCDRITPTWVTEDNEDGTYTHTATIAAMREDGAVLCEGLTLAVDGTSVSYTDDSQNATSAYVYYELAVPVTGTVSMSPNISIEDWGLEYLVGATGSAYVTTEYSQGYPDTLAGLAAGGLDQKLLVLTEAVALLSEQLDSLDKRLAKPGRILPESVDAREYLKDLYPVSLRGAGAPSASIRPSNIDDELPWDGYPVFVGQEYLDTTNKKVYKAFGVSAISDWIALN